MSGVQEQKWEIPFPKFRNGKGVKQIDSQISGTELRGFHSREFPLTPGKYASTCANSRPQPPFDPTKGGNPCSKRSEDLCDMVVDPLGPLRALASTLAPPPMHCLPLPPSAGAESQQTKCGKEITRNQIAPRLERGKESQHVESC